MTFPSPYLAAAAVHVADAEALVARGELGLAAERFEKAAGEYACAGRREDRIAANGRAFDLRRALGEFPGVAA